MAKSKKSDSEKESKKKDVKPLKAEKSAKEKKGKKKDKAAAEAVTPKPVKTVAPPAKKPVAPKKAVAAVAVTFTTEEIGLRAYYIAERRQAMGWPGDSTNDWVEAERQLKAEARRAKQ